MEVEGLLENIYFNLLSEWERYGGREGIGGHKRPKPPPYPFPSTGSQATVGWAVGRRGVCRRRVCWRSPPSGGNDHQIWPSQAAKIPYAWEGMGRAGNLDIDTPALPHAPTVDINRLGTGGRVLVPYFLQPRPLPMPKEPRKSQEFLRDFLGYLGMGKGWEPRYRHPQPFPYYTGRRND